MSRSTRVQASVPLVVGVVCYGVLLAIIGRGIADRVTHAEPAQPSISDPCGLLSDATVSAVFQDAQVRSIVDNPVRIRHAPFGDVMEQQVLVGSQACTWVERDAGAKSSSRVWLEVRRYESEQAARYMFDQLWKGQRIDIPDADAALRRTMLEWLAQGDGPGRTGQADCLVVAQDGTVVVRVDVQSARASGHELASPDANAEPGLLTRGEAIEYAERAATDVTRRF